MEKSPQMSRLLLCLTVMTACQPVAESNPNTLTPSATNQTITQITPTPFDRISDISPTVQPPKIHVTIQSTKIAQAPPSSPQVNRRDELELSDLIYLKPQPETESPHPVELSISDSFLKNNPELENLIFSLSAEYGVDSALIIAIIAEESRGKSTAVSEDGATGIMQVMPENFEEGENPNSLETNLRRGIQILKNQLIASEGNVDVALAGYNGGPVARWWFAGTNEEYEERRKIYIQAISDYLIDAYNLSEEDATKQAEYKAWEVETYVKNITNRLLTYNQD